MLHNKKNKDEVVRGIVQEWEKIVHEKAKE